MKEYEDFLKYIKVQKAENTYNNYKNANDKMISEFNPESPKDLEKLTYKDWLNFQTNLAEKFAISSVNNYFLNISSFLTYLGIDMKEFKKVKQMKVRKSQEELDEQYFTLTDEQVRAMVKAAKTKDEKLMIKVAFHTGFRAEALTRIKLSDIRQDEDGTWRIHTVGKGDKHHSVAIPDDMKSSIDYYIDNRNSKSDYLFISMRGKGKPMTPQAVWLRFKRIGKDSGLSDEETRKLHPHTARKTLGTKIAQKHGMLVAQKILGHSDISTTKRYINMDEIDDDFMARNQYRSGDENLNETSTLAIVELIHSWYDFSGFYGTTCFECHRLINVLIDKNSWNGFWCPHCGTYNRKPQKYGMWQMPHYGTPRQVYEKALEIAEEMEQKWSIE